MIKGKKVTIIIEEKKRIKNQNNKLLENLAK